MYLVRIDDESFRAPLNFVQSIEAHFRKRHAATDHQYLKIYGYSADNFSEAALYQQEVEAYRRLAVCPGIAPTLIACLSASYEIISARGSKNIWEVRGLLLERWGQSLSARFSLRRPTQYIDVANNILTDLSKRDQVFPPTLIPAPIVTIIVEKLRTLLILGIHHDDVHTGNILINDQNEVRIIDFEYWTDLRPGCQ